MSITFTAIIIESIIQSISCICGIPGVPAFARIANFNSKITEYPDGYQLKYDCIHPHRLKLNGDKNRVCKDNLWTPRQIPICEIEDPDDERMYKYQLEILDSNNNNKKNGTFQNNWTLFKSQISYTENLRKSFITYASNETNLWRIKFGKQYPVEIDHSFLVIIVFVIPFNSTHNNSNFNIEIKSELTSTQRTCRKKTEKDSIDKLFKGFNSTSLMSSNMWKKDIFHKISMECRIDWMDRPFRWQKTSELEYFTGINLTLKINSSSPVELILTQLTVDPDCGYPDIPINGNYSKSWMNAIYSCDSGQVMGEKNISCKYSGRWDEPMVQPKCCVGNQCEIENQNETRSDSTVIVIIIFLSSTVVMLSILVMTLMIRTKKIQKTQAIQSIKSIDNDYDKDLGGDQTYDDIQQPDYDEIKFNENVENNYFGGMSMKVIKEMEGDIYVEMGKCNINLSMTSKSVNETEN